MPFVTCPECEHESVAPRELIGLEWACPKCGSSFVVEDGDPRAPLRRRKRNRRGPWVAMFFLCLSGLFVFGLMAFAVSHAEVARNDGNNALLIAALLIFGLLIYLFPTLIATLRGHNNTVPIFVINLFFGWSLLGWVVALVWATINPRKDRRR
jgi:hypothetical protein